MKKLRFVLLGIAFLFLYTFVVYFSQPIGDVVYRIPHLFASPSAQINFFAGPEVPDPDQLVLRGASWGSDGTSGEVSWGIEYRSWYDASDQRYYYEFQNFSKEPICMRSPLFSLLIGKRNIYLAPKGIAHFAFPYGHQFSLHEKVFDLKFSDGDCSTGLSAASRGTSINILAPASMR